MDKVGSIKSYLTQVVQANITGAGPCWHHVPEYGLKRISFHLLKISYQKPMVFGLFNAIYQAPRIVLSIKN